VSGGVDLSFIGTLSVDGSTLNTGGGITGSNEASIFVMNGSSVSAAAVGLQSEGVIVVSDSSLNIAGSLSNSDLAGISIQHSVVNAGTIENTAEATILQIGGGSVVAVQHNFFNGNISGNPNFSLDAGSSLLVGGAYVNGDSQSTFIGGTLQTNSFSQSGGTTLISGLLYPLRALK
jgi:hypothetical protein